MSDNLSVTCPNCGAALPEGLEACSHCGALLAQPQLVATELASLPAPPPQSPAAQAPLPPTDFSASASATLGGGLRVNRVTNAKVYLTIPQSAVDKQGWLTSEQWERLIAAYSRAFADHVKMDMAAGQPLDVGDISMLCAKWDSGITAVPWEQVGDSLTTDQRDEIERGLHGLLASLRAAGAATPSDLPTAIAAPPPAKGSATCGIVIFVLGLMAAGATAYFLAR